MKHLISCIAMTFFALSAWGHGGEDHGDGTAPAAVNGIAPPRAAAHTEEFELVVVLADGKLTLFLDRYADNAPVPDAEIEVESGTFKAVAVQVAPGVYALPAEAFAKPGKHPLIVSVQAGENADLLSAALDIAEPAATAGRAYAWTAWAAAGALLLIGAALLVMRRKKNRED
jgi:LPXTG-motif cell wall-anchored protein